AGGGGGGVGGVLSRVLKSLMALPSERDSSGSFLAPKKKTPIASAINRSWVPIMAVLLRPHGCSRVVAVDHGVIALDHSGGRWSTNGGGGGGGGGVGPRRPRRGTTGGAGAGFDGGDRRRRGAVPGGPRPGRRRARPRHREGRR